MASPIRIKRGTRAQLNTAAAANQLVAGEPYLITDEGRIAIGRSTSTYETFAKETERLRQFPPAPSDISAAVNSTSVGTATQAASTLRAFPWEIREAVSLSIARVDVSTAVAGSTMRTAFYLSNSSHYPTTIVAGSEVTFDTGTTGLKAITYPSAILMPPGLYFVVSNASAAPVVRGFAGSAISSILGLNPAGGTAMTYTCWSIASTYGALPSTFPGGAAKAGNISLPAFIYRRI